MSQDHASVLLIKRPSSKGHASGARNLLSVSLPAPPAPRGAPRRGACAAPAIPDRPPALPVRLGPRGWAGRRQINRFTSRARASPTACSEAIGS